MNRQLSSGFSRRRWRGEADLRLLFWRDMLVAGSFVNLSASFMALALASQDVAMGIAVAVHFAPLPYNVFLLVAVLRSPRRTAPMALAAWIWFVLMALA